MIIDFFGEEITDHYTAPFASHSVIACLDLRANILMVTTHKLLIFRIPKARFFNLSLSKISNIKRHSSQMEIPIGYVRTDAKYILQFLVGWMEYKSGLHCIQLVY